MKISLEALESLLVILLLRCEELKLLLQKVENEIAILKRLILEMKQAEADKQAAERKPSPFKAPEISPITAVATPRKRVKKVIEACEVRPFLHQAAQFWNVLKRRFNIHIKYTWFCQFICLRYSLKRQRGGIPGSDLSPTTVLSYFKKERAGIL